MGRRQPGLEADDEVPAVYLLGSAPAAKSCRWPSPAPANTRTQAARSSTAHRDDQLDLRKSISKDGGRDTYRGLLKVAKGARGHVQVVCDALLLDEKTRSDTYPTIEIDENDAYVGHEATVSRIGEEQLFYLQSRGLSETEAKTMIVNGFIEPSPRNCRWSTRSR